MEIDENGVCHAGPDGVILVYPSAEGEMLPVAGARWPLRRNGSGYTIRQPESGRTLHFGPAESGVAKIVAINDRNGHRIDFDYADGIVSGIRHSGGYHLTVDTHDGLVTGLRPGHITLVRYNYDERRRLVAVINSSERALRFEYDVTGRIVRWEDRNGQWYRYHYDESGRCVRTEASGHVLTGTVAYDPVNRVTVETDSLGNVTTHQFNEAHKPIRRLDPLGHEIHQEWDVEARLISRADALGGTTRYTHDERGNITAIHRPDGSTLRAEYNLLNLPVVIVGADGRKTSYTYDDRGNRTSVTDASGAVTNLRYDERGPPHRRDRRDRQHAHHHLQCGGPAPIGHRPARQHRPLHPRPVQPGHQRDRLAEQITTVLIAHHVPDAIIDQERRHMQTRQLGATTNRSVVGIMTEFARLAEIHHEADPAIDLIALAARPATTPCGPLYDRNISPDRELAATLHAIAT